MNILYAVEIEDFHRYLFHFKNDKFLSLDVEGTQSGTIELVQIGNATTALLIPVWKYGIPQGLHLLLNSPDTVKLVWGPNEQLEFEKVGAKLQGVIDVQQISNSLGCSKKLDDASTDILTGDLIKYRKRQGFSHSRFKSWATDALPSFATRYAASDVFSVYHIFQSFCSYPIDPVKLSSDDFFSRLLKKRVAMSSFSLFKNLSHFIKGEVNEIAKLLFFTQTLFSFATCPDPLLKLTKHPSFELSDIKDVSDSIQFLLYTRIDILPAATCINKLNIPGYDESSPISINKSADVIEPRSITLAPFPLVFSEFSIENAEFEAPAISRKLKIAAFKPKSVKLMEPKVSSVEDIIVMANQSTPGVQIERELHVIPILDAASSDGVEDVKSVRSKHRANRQQA